MINFADVKEITVGGQKVTSIAIDGVNVWNGIKMYDGVPCYIDNAFFDELGNLPLSRYFEDDVYFLAFCDIGSAPKTILFGYNGLGNASRFMRCFNEDPKLGNKSVDYWSVTKEERSVSMIGRYCVFTVIKSQAKYFRVLDSNGNYYIKGSEVI